MKQKKFMDIQRIKEGFIDGFRTNDMIAVSYTHLAYINTEMVLNSRLLDQDMLEV